MHPAVSYNVLDEISGRGMPIGSDNITVRPTTTTTSSSCESSAGAQRRRPSGMSHHSTQDEPQIVTFERDDDGHVVNYSGVKRVSSAYSHVGARNSDGFR